MFNFEFIKGLIPLVIEEINYRFKTMEESSQFPKFYIYNDVFIKTLGSVTAKSFFGEKILEQKINGEDIQTSYASLVREIGLANRNLDVFLLGTYAVHLGLKKQYRDLKKKAILYNSIAKAFIR